jgi:hypothetical protein
MKIPMSELLSFMTIGSGATLKLIGTSPSSRTGRIPSPHSSMLIVPICRRNVIFDMLGMYQEWTTELVAQFCATAWSGYGYENALNFSIEGHQFVL